MKIDARINANGNDRKDFVQAYMALTAVNEAINNAMSLLATNVLHGRNYPHIVSLDESGLDESALTADYDREAVRAKLTVATHCTRDVQQALMAAINGDDA